MNKLAIIVPCYNEGEGIKYLHSQLMPVVQNLGKKFEIELIFVDDGSNDNTYELLQNIFPYSYAKIIKHDVNQNLGAAMRTGFQNCTGDYVVTMDSDCTYNPAEISNMLNLLHDADIVTASPYHPDGKVENVPTYRLLLSKCISIIYRLLTWKNIYTFTALFRVHRRRVIEDIKFRSNDFMATAEILIKCLNQGYRVKEYPTTLHARQYGQSKMRLLQVIISHIRLIIRIATLRL